MDIRQSYEKINISEQAKNQIKNDILAGKKTVRKENGSGAYKKYGKIAVAAASFNMVILATLSTLKSLIVANVDSKPSRMNNG